MTASNNPTLKSGTAAANAKSLSVALGARSYRIDIGAGLLAHTPAALKEHFARPKTAIITDRNVAKLHLETLTRALDDHGFEHSNHILPPGEATKSFDQLIALCDDLLAAGIERQDTIIALGGGVIGDLGGFAAAILRRGVKFIQIPTSLLAQVDSSVGGKTGINSKHGKNLIGAFHQPAAVLADIDLLATLPAREFRAGYAEVVKYGALGDAALFDWLEQTREAIFSGDREARMTMIAACCNAKAEIVARDERESGARALLNLGHTFGHALEAAAGYSARLLHGEGIAIGMVLAARLSEQLEYCAPGAAARIENHLNDAGLPTRIGDIDGDICGPDELLDIMMQDKKTVAGKMNLILLNKLGDAFITGDVTAERLRAFLAQEYGRG